MSGVVVSWAIALTSAAVERYCAAAAVRSSIGKASLIFRCRAAARLTRRSAASGVLGKRMRPPVHGSGVCLLHGYGFKCSRFRHSAAARSSWSSRVRQKSPAGFSLPLLSQRINKSGAFSKNAARDGERNCLSIGIIIKWHNSRLPFCFLSNRYRRLSKSAALFLFHKVKRIPQRRRDIG